LFNAPFPEQRDFSMQKKFSGFESVSPTSPESHNTQTDIPQNPTESDSSAKKETAQNDKTITTPEQEKDTLLHEKCATGVHQNSLRFARELELVIKAWPDLSVEARETIMSIISNKEEKK
jgi:hypothetical protein